MAGLYLFTSYALPLSTLCVYFGSDCLMLLHLGFPLNTSIIIIIVAYENDLFIDLRNEMLICRCCTGTTLIPFCHFNYLLTYDCKIAPQLALLSSLDISTQLLLFGFTVAEGVELVSGTGSCTSILSFSDKALS